MPDEAPIPPILLLGCGRMGAALLRGWQSQGLAASCVIDPAPVAIDAPHRHVTDPADLPDGFNPAVIILAVKPQTADAAIAGISHRGTMPDRASTGPATGASTGGPVVLSIMAGRTLAGLASAFPSGTAIVRAMPNTPAAIGQGITVACPGAHVTAAQRSLCDRLLKAVGDTAWVEDEALLDPVTAISGSGPAYIFLLAELLEAAGREQGLPPALARQLARRTVSGAGALLEASPAEESEALRRAVTSPGGTTERALAVLMQETAWPENIRTAIEAATQRSRALAG